MTKQVLNVQLNTIKNAKTRQEAYDAFRAISDTAEEVYEETIKPARKAFEAIENQAMEAFEAIRNPALKTYENWSKPKPKEKDGVKSNNIVKSENKPGKVDAPKTKLTEAQLDTISNAKTQHEALKAYLAISTQVMEVHKATINPSLEEFKAIINPAREALKYRIKQVPIKEKGGQ